MDIETSVHDRLVSGFLLHPITVILLSALSIIFKVSNFIPIIFLGKTTLNNVVTLKSPIG